MTKRFIMNKYSDVISSEKYNNIRAQHVYLNESDRVVIDLLSKFVELHTSRNSKPEVLELGCGPFSLTGKLLSVQHNLTAVEVDPVFFAYAKERNKSLNPQATIYRADVMNYEHKSLVDIVVSQGFHHHIDSSYLGRVSKLLADDGIYILSDEFLPPYEDERQRKIKAIGWYCHVIADAIRNGFNDLAREEAGTLIDEINGKKLTIAKIFGMVSSILSSSETISTAENVGDRDELSRILLEKMETASEGKIYKNLLSRGDYKISLPEFEKQIADYGFTIINHQSIGLVDEVGGFRIFVLQKQ